MSQRGLVLFMFCVVAIGAAAGAITYVAVVLGIVRPLLGRLNAEAERRLVVERTP